MLNAVALKLQEFWETSASAWFAQVEAQFALQDITADATKHYYVALSSATAMQVVAILTNPPTVNKHETLKVHLLKTLELLDAKRASHLFSLQGLGDSKPTELMDRMGALMGEHKLGFLSGHLFLWQLPVANTTISDCCALAEEADHFFLADQHQGSTSSGFSTYWAPAKCCRPLCSYAKERNARAGIR